MDDLWSMALLWSPLQFLSILLNYQGWWTWVAVLGVLGLVLGIALAVVHREPGTLILIPALVLTHSWYVVAALLHLWMNWLGVPLMIALDASCIAAQLALAGFAIAKSRRSRIATASVSLFSVVYALPFLLFTYLFTYYVGL